MNIIGRLDLNHVRVGFALLYLHSQWGITGKPGYDILWQIEDDIWACGTNIRSMLAGTI